MVGVIRHSHPALVLPLDAPVLDHVMPLLAAMHAACTPCQSRHAEQIAERGVDDPATILDLLDYGFTPIRELMSSFVDAPEEHARMACHASKTLLGLLRVGDRPTALRSLRETDTATRRNVVDDALDFLAARDDIKVLT